MATDEFGNPAFTKINQDSEADKNDFDLLAANMDANIGWFRELWLRMLSFIRKIPSPF